jgi:hypothetical protein
MKKLLTAVFAIALVGIASAADAGIIIRFSFGPRIHRVHRVHRHYAPARRHHREPETRVAKSEPAPVATAVHAVTPKSASVWGR